MGRFNFNEKDFLKIKREAKKFYKTINFVICPYFKEKIIFNSKGLKHLRFKSDKKARPHKDQYPRLKLLKYAPEILKKSHTLQGILDIKRIEAQKTNSRWEHVMKKVMYYEFIAVIDNIRIKLIVKEIQGSEKHFWSIIPFWGIDKFNSKRILHSGNPEND